MQPDSACDPRAACHGSKGGHDDAGILSQLRFEAEQMVNDGHQDNGHQRGKHAGHGKRDGCEARADRPTVAHRGSMGSDETAEGGSVSRVALPKRVAVSVWLEAAFSLAST